MKHNLIDDYWKHACELLDLIIVKTALEKLNEHLGVYRSSAPTQTRSLEPTIDLNDGLQLITHKVETSHPKWDKVMHVIYFNGRKIIGFNLPYRNLFNHLNNLSVQQTAKINSRKKAINEILNLLKTESVFELKSTQSAFNNEDESVKLTVTNFRITVVIKNPVTDLVAHVHTVGTEYVSPFMSMFQTLK